VSRPAGEPGALAAGARSLGAAAGALRDVRGRLDGATSLVVVAGAWRGPASEAFLRDGAGLQRGLDRAAEALGQAAGALAELAARLEQAQAAWDRARRLAATAGVELDPRGGILPPTGATDPAAMAAAGQAARLAAAADQDAAAARRTAAARLDHAATLVPAGRGHQGGTGHDQDGHRLRAVAARVLEAGTGVATATHHLAAGAEARVRAAGRLAAAADDPAVRSAAARVVDTAGRPLLDGRVLHALPLVAPVLDLAAGVSEGEPFPRALAGAIGGAVGADVGGRVGLAVCGGQAAATQGVGMVVCPTLTAVGGAVGAHAGKQAALHLYDRVAGPPEPPPPSRGSP
jgi:uncharacterized protein YukE